MAISILNALFVLIAISAPIVNILSCFFTGWFMWVVIADLAGVIIVMTFLFFERSSPVSPLSFDFLGSPLTFTAYLHAVFAAAMFVMLRHPLATWYTVVSTVFVVYALLLLRSCQFTQDCWTWRTCAMAILVTVLVDAGFDTVSLYMLMSVAETMSAGKLTLIIITYALQLQYVIYLSSFSTKTLWRSFDPKPVRQELYASPVQNQLWTYKLFQRCCNCVIHPSFPESVNKITLVVITYGQVNID